MAWRHALGLVSLALVLATLVRACADASAASRALCVADCRAVGLRRDAAAPPGGCPQGAAPKWLRLRGGGDGELKDDDVEEAPTEFPHIPTDELSEDERETLHMFRDVERQYHEGAMSPDARQHLEEWVARQSAELEHGTWCRFRPLCFALRP